MDISKDKALELVNRFKYVEVRGIEIERMSTSLAKQCTLICVDEIIKTYKDIDPKLKYWKEVKQEIQKL